MKKSTLNEFIEKAKKIHGDKYDYSLIKYTNSKTKVEIICKEHGIFYQTPKAHLIHNCPRCFGNARLSTKEFIEKSVKIHGDKYDYSLVDYKNSDTIVQIICKKHGVFKQRSSTHLNGHGCYKCSKHNINNDEFIEQARKVHGDKYDYSLLNFDKKTDKITIICPKHGVFEQVVTSHISGCGCSKCSKHCLTLEEFIEKSKKIHGNKYDYSLINNYENSNSIVQIICPKHGIFKQRADSHFTHSCRKCQNENRSEKRRMKLDDVLKQFKNAHGEHYDYSLVDYKNKRTKIKIICPIHGIFEQKPDDHKTGNGCLKSSIENKKNIKRKDKEWLDKCIKKYNNKFDYSLVRYVTNEEKVKIICPIHGVFKQAPCHHYEIGCAKCNYEKRISISQENFIYQSKIIHNNKYDYSLVIYKGNKIKVKIICPKHGVFEQKPNLHFYHGCHFCNESKGEKQIQFILDKKNIKYNREHKFDDCKYKRKLPFDFYLPDFNTCIEYDGAQHFSRWEKWENDEKDFEIRKIRDNIKNEYCKKNKIKLIRIKYTENVDKKLIPILESLSRQ